MTLIEARRMYYFYDSLLEIFHINTFCSKIKYAEKKNYPTCSKGQVPRSLAQLYNTILLQIATEDRLGYDNLGMKKKVSNKSIKESTISWYHKGPKVTTKKELTVSLKLYFSRIFHQTPDCILPSSLVVKS